MALPHETEVSDAVPKAQHRTLTMGLTITAQQFLNSHFLLQALRQEREVVGIAVDVHAFQ